MALNKSWGYTPSTTPIKGTGNIMSFPISDFVVTSNVPGEVYLTNKSAPIDQPERIRYALQLIADIYKGTLIDPAYFATSKKGASFVTQSWQQMSITDPANPSFRVDLPIGYHTVIRFPDSPYLTVQDIFDGYLRHFSSQFTTADGVTADQWAAQLRGALLPKGIS